MHLACGLSVGLTGLAAGYAIGIVGDMGVRSYMQQSRIFVGMVLILIFGEVLGLYGSVNYHPTQLLSDLPKQPYCGSYSQHKEQRLDGYLTKRIPKQGKKLAVDIERSYEDYCLITGAG